MNKDMINKKCRRIAQEILDNKDGEYQDIHDDYKAMGTPITYKECYAIGMQAIQDSLMHEPCSIVTGKHSL